MRHEFDLWLRRILRGGEPGQVLQKASDDDHDFEWVEPQGGGDSSKSYAFFVGS